LRSVCNPVRNRCEPHQQSGEMYDGSIFHPPNIPDALFPLSVSGPVMRDERDYKDITERVRQAVWNLAT